MCVHGRKYESAFAIRQQGFTLIEVMIVCSIIAIMTMVAAPAYVQWKARYQMRQATTELAGNISLARMAAMNRNAAVTVNLALIAGKVNVAFGGVFPPVTMPDKITGVTGGPLQFTQRGLLAATGNQTVTLTSDQGSTYSVVVTPAGKVNWCPKASCP